MKKKIGICVGLIVGAIVCAVAVSALRPLDEDDFLD